METLTQFLETIQDIEHRESLQNVLHWVSKKFPELNFKIAWKQPMFTLHDTFIVGFSASKQHFSVSPETKGIEIFSKDIQDAGYTHGSNLFRIRWIDKIDYDLLEQIIRYNMEDKKNCTTFWRKA